MKRGEGGLNQPLSNREKAKRALQAAVLGALAATAAPNAADAPPVEKSITQSHSRDKIKLPPRDPRNRTIEYIINHGGDLPERGIAARSRASQQPVSNAVPLPRPKPRETALDPLKEITPQAEKKATDLPVFPSERSTELPFARIIPPSGVIPVPPAAAEQQEARDSVPLPQERPPKADWRPETRELIHSRDAFVRTLTFSTRGYEGPRIEKENYRRLKPSGLAVRPQNDTIERLHFHAKLGQFSLAGSKGDILLGKFERSLRFKNITDAVEARYNLPPGLLLAMLIQESSGVDAFPNGRDDGGIGLIHMQPAAATEFGLRTHGNNRAIVDKAHGVALRTLIAEKNGNSFALSQDDERFNRLLNIDAVGRMLATHMSGDRIKGLGPLRTAFKRYTGKRNYEPYLDRVRELMRQLNDPKFLGVVAKRFDDRNRALIINGKYVGDATSPFAAYTKAMWDENENGFDLAAYRKLPRYETEDSVVALRTYKEFFMEEKEPIQQKKIAQKAKPNPKKRR